MIHNDKLVRQPMVHCLRDVQPHNQSHWMVSRLANIQQSGLTTLLRTLVFTWGNNVMEKRQHAKLRKESFVSIMWKGTGQI